MGLTSGARTLKSSIFYTKRCTRKYQAWGFDAGCKYNDESVKTGCCCRTEMTFENETQAKCRPMTGRNVSQYCRHMQKKQNKKNPPANISLENTFTHLQTHQEQTRRCLSAQFCLWCFRQSWKNEFLCIHRIRQKWQKHTLQQKWRLKWKHQS